MQQIATNCVEGELSYKIVKYFYNVRNKYGMHHNERVYHKALIEELEINEVDFISKPRIDLFSLTTGKRLTYYEPDLIIKNKIIIELKAKYPIVTNEQVMQVIEYLKISKYEVAYLINFKEFDFRPRRFIHTSDRKKFIIN